MLLCDLIFSCVQSSSLCDMIYWIISRINACLSFSFFRELKCGFSGSSGMKGGKLLGDLFCFDIGLWSENPYLSLYFGLFPLSVSIKETRWPSLLGEVVAELSWAFFFKRSLPFLFPARIGVTIDGFFSKSSLKIIFAGLSYTRVFWLMTL